MMILKLVSILISNGKRRVMKEFGIPNVLFIISQKVWTGFNDLESNNSELASQWHPTKNGDLTPQTIAAFSNKKVWWLYSYVDPKTGKHFDFEWEARGRQ